MAGTGINALSDTNLTERWVFIDTSVAANRLGTTPVLIIPGRRASRRVVQNLGATDIILGDQNVAASGGLPAKGHGILLKGGQTPPDSWTDAVGSGPYYAITADGSTGYAGYVAGLMTSSVTGDGSYTN